MEIEKFAHGEVAGLLKAKRVHLICDMYDGQLVRIVRVNDADFYHVSYLDGRGIIPVSGKNLRKLTPLEQLAVIGE